MDPAIIVSICILPIIVASLWAVELPGPADRVLRSMVEGIDKEWNEDTKRLPPHMQAKLMAVQGRHHSVSQSLDDQIADIDKAWRATTLRPRRKE